MIRRRWPISSRRPRAASGRQFSAWPSTGPGRARRQGPQALPEDRHRGPRQLPRLAPRITAPAPGNDNRRLRRRPAGQAVKPPGTRGTYRNDGAICSLSCSHSGTTKISSASHRAGRSWIRSGCRPRDGAGDEQLPSQDVEGLPSREFASGLTITRRAVARIGYLYFREGDGMAGHPLPRVTSGGDPAHRLPEDHSLLRLLLGERQPRRSRRFRRRRTGPSAWAKAWWSSARASTSSPSGSARLRVLAVPPRRRTEWDKKVAGFFRLVVGWSRRYHLRVHPIPPAR